MAQTGDVWHHPVMLPYVTPEDIEALLSREGLYVTLPLATADDAAELFNRLLDSLQGEQQT